MLNYNMISLDANRSIFPFCCNNNDLLQTTEIQPLVTSASPNLITPVSLIDEPVMDPVISNVISMSPGPSRSKSRNKANDPTVMSRKTMLSPSNFNSINPSADLRLPAEIFASDDSVSDAGFTTNEETDKKMMNHALLQASLLGSDSDVPSKDKMLGGINIKVEKSAENSKSSKKSKRANKETAYTLNLADIKTELMDDLDWNNMTLATVNNNNVNRLQTV